jgi:hypothetical protein
MNIYICEVNGVLMIVAVRVRNWVPLRDEEGIQNEIRGHASMKKIEVYMILLGLVGCFLAGCIFSQDTYKESFSYTCIITTDSIGIYRVIIPIPSTLSNDPFNIFNISLSVTQGLCNYTIINSSYGLGLEIYAYGTIEIISKGDVSLSNSLSMMNDSKKMTRDHWIFFNSQNVSTLSFNLCFTSNNNKGGGMEERVNKDIKDIGWQILEFKSNRWDS